MLDAPSQKASGAPGWGAAVSHMLYRSAPVGFCIIALVKRRARLGSGRTAWREAEALGGMRAGAASGKWLTPEPSNTGYATRNYHGY